MLQIIIHGNRIGSFRHRKSLEQSVLLPFVPIEADCLNLCSASCKFLDDRPASILAAVIDEDDFMAFPNHFEESVYFPEEFQQGTGAVIYRNDNRIIHKCTPLRTSAHLHDVELDQIFCYTHLIYIAKLRKERDELMKRIDCFGDICPIPLLKLHNEINQMHSGETFLMVVDHSCVIENIREDLAKSDLSYRIEEVLNGVWEISVTKL